MPPAVAGGDRAVRGQEVAADAAASLTVLFPHLAGLDATRVADAGDAVVVFASVMGDRARYRRCGQSSSRVHGRYQRLLAGGRPQATSPIHTTAPNERQSQNRRAPSSIILAPQHE
jgi:hypothetical protein